MAISKKKTFPISVLLNIILLGILLIALFTSNFDLYLFKKTIPYVCSLADKRGEIFENKTGERIAVGNLCLENDLSPQVEEAPEEEPRQ